MFDLQLLPAGFVERLVVGDLHHHAGDVVAEPLCQFLLGRVGVFHCVVQHGGTQSR